jgi:MFS family permease
MLAFGLTIMATGWTQNLGGLIACRVVLGVLESGGYPGCMYMLSMWYRRNECLTLCGQLIDSTVQKRITLCFAISALTGSFSGCLLLT